jgi:cytochrome c2
MIKIALMGCVLVLAATAAGADEPPPLYKAKCELCHSIGGTGGLKKDLGGPLDSCGTVRDEAWLRAYFADPKSKIEGAKMPKMPLTPAEWDEMVAYMLTLKAPAAEAPAE